MCLSRSSLSWLGCCVVHRLYLRTMKTRIASPVVLLKLMHITLVPGLQAQRIKVEPEVTGYVGHDVTLPCQLIPGPNHSIITQVQWELKQLNREKIIILVSNEQLGVSTHETFLKDRVNITGQSLIIRSVEMTDAGQYTCSIATFPAGSFEGTTNFVVQEQMPSSSGVLSAIVIAVLLLFVIMAAIVYLIFIRRPGSSVRHRVSIDTSGTSVARPSVLVRQEDVVYSDVKPKSSRNATPSSSDRHTEATGADDVTYSEVVLLRRQPE
ncbi:T-cell immunoreceptor with Ig and ITIM domains-like isoform X2 [Chelmon rostratus]|uniref:T-cell immunoreceptor with Ig and ITIM domains-like isoform X2 n=1 Tax=Chelmon rostratus TaxID=109905 RepID=UPI001BEBC6B2|nr:T-cell immunoreceptor with Ig and ITIM domains-like isoform X2 [Chelmon rostratus]